MRRTVWVSALVAVVILGALVLNIMRGGEDASSVSSGGEDKALLYVFSSDQNYLLQK